MTQRLRSILLFFVLPTAAAVGACDCAGNRAANGDCSISPDGSACDTGVCCGGACSDGTGWCPPGETCDGNLMCSAGEGSCDCVPLPPLQPGRLADDLDSTVQQDGTLVFAGYSPGNPDLVNRGKYGDLVVGTYDGSQINWEIVDGVPSGGTIGGAIAGWRGGNTTPGDDVGRYPSIEANGNDLVVAYADLTNGSLKAAARVGGEWSLFDVDAEAGDIVAWTSMALDPAGIPIVAYLVMKKPDTTAEPVQTQPQSVLRIARPTTALPEAGDWVWSHYDIATAEMGCHVDLCADGYACITEGSCVPEDGTGDCDPACGSDVCYNAVCYQEKKASDYLVANGLFTDIEPTADGFALVYYDRGTGHLYARQCAVAPCDDVSDWTPEDSTALIDGWGSARPGAGDCGIGASLFVDASGDWHVSYVDGSAEELRYARRASGGGAWTYELIDDGTPSLTGLARPQLSYVGDDSSIVASDVSGGREIRVAYADVTLHTTVVATRAPAGGWSYRELTPTGEASFSVTQCNAGGDQSYIGSMWFQVATPATDGLFLSDTDVFPIPTPVDADGGV